MWIAIQDDAPVGFANFTDEDHFGRFSVRPDHQRCGVVSALLAMAEQGAQQWGIARLTADASSTGLPFSKARGFKVVKA